MTGLLQDLRYGTRLLLKNPGFTVIAVITLALGIGANTAIFSVVSGVLLSDLPYPDPDELVFLWQSHPDIPVMSISYPDYTDWVERTRLFEEIAVYRRVSMNLTGVDEPRELSGAMSSANLFRAAGVSPAIGREFSRDDDQPGAEDVVILSHSLWKGAFDEDPAIVGRDLHLGGKTRTVVGVMPEGFVFPSRVEFWVPVGPMGSTPGWAERGNHPGLFGLARLADGVTTDQAGTEMESLSEALALEYPDTNEGTGVALTPLREIVVRNIRPALLVLQGAVGLVLLIACANVTNLMLGRAAARRKEVAIRVALGAGRGRIIRMLLVESTLLALAGGGLGLVLASWGIDSLVALAAGSLPSASVIAIDRSVLLFTLGLSLLTGFVFGMIPAWQGSMSHLGESLKESGRTGSGGRKTRRIRSLLVVSEVAVALVLLVGAGLMTKSFVRLSDVEPGFEPGNLLTVRVTLPESLYPDIPSHERFFERLFEELRRLPGVDDVGLTSNLPFLDGSQTSFWISGRPLPPDGNEPMADYSVVSSDYFEVMGVPLLQGRSFDERDGEGKPRVVVVDELLARQYFPDENPVGKVITDGGEDIPDNRLKIVGLAGSIRLQGLNVEPPRPQLYFPLTQARPLQTSLLVRGQGSVEGLVPAIRRAVLEVDPDQPVSRVMTMGAVIEGSLAPWRLNMVLISLLSATAALLAAVGLYGVVSSMVTQRTREIGIRMALGAGSRDVLRLVLRQGMGLTLVGIITGVLVALGLTRLIASLLFGVEPTDVMSFAGVVVLLSATALGACWVPARRASRVDPMTALRYE